MELSYEKCGDYYIPNIALLDTATTKSADMVVCGVYFHILILETFWNHLEEIDVTCNKRLDNLIPAMAQRGRM